MRFKDEILVITDEEYRNIDAFSYSLLKTMDDEGPLSILGQTKKTGPALEFGSLVDILITDPESKDTKFHTKTIDKPSASTLILADMLVNDHLLLDIPIEEITTDEYILKTIRNLKIWDNIKNLETLKEKYNNKLFKEYVEEKIRANGKIVVSEETLTNAIQCANVLKDHPFTKNLFIPSNTLEILKQPSIVYQYEGTIGKARIDLLHINHETKMIDIMDIKTGSELPSRFHLAFYKWKYYLQVISYTGAISWVLNHSKNFNDYQINSFKFIYVSKKMPLVPVIYEVPDRLLPHFLHGWISQTGEKIKGFKSLVNEYRQYRGTNTYSVEKEVLDNNGVFKLELS
jgi:hypothetical protein